MKVAIPVFGSRVSPLFDTATRLLVLVCDGDAESARDVLAVSQGHPTARVSALQGLEVDVLICGGISRVLAALVEQSGIRLIPWMAGEVEEVLTAFKSGRLPDPRFLMPGCGRRFRHGSGRVRGWENSSLYPWDHLGDSGGTPWR